jgi:3-hexulose-6-phosphate synthase/6-phospho-3-hexuloisomerase
MIKLFTDAVDAGEILPRTIHIYVVQSVIRKHMEPVLQVALDFQHLKRAVQAAEEAVAGGADWVEAGTPLIKSEGVEAVRALKRMFPSRVIVADLKVMDTGSFEVEIAAKAGAEVITVMAVADDGTMKEAVKAARRYGAKIMADLMSVEDMPKRTKELQGMGVDYLCIHVSIDEQMTAHTPMQKLREVCQIAEIPVAVAGGLNSETVADALEAGASIIIVGGAITKAEKVADAARAIKDAMSKREKIHTELYKKYGEEDLFEAFAKVSTPNISDAMQKRGEMKGMLPRISRKAKMVGRALTVKTADGDWAKPVEAIDRAKKGDVIVIDVGGGPTAVWGELASWSAKVKGVAGVVIDGAARDIDTILDIGFPVFSRFVTPKAGEPKGHGEIASEIECGGQLVRTGDWIVGDENGVIVIPQEIAVEIANRSLDVLERENRIREEIKRGGTLSSVLELEKWEKVG